MNWAEEYKAGRLKSESYVLASTIYDSICDGLNIGTRKPNKGQNKIDNNHDRSITKSSLRAKLRYLINVIARSDYSSFKVNNKIVLIPIADAPVIQMLLTASITKKIEDWLISQWLKGRFETLQIDDYGFVTILFSTLKDRIEKLHQNGQIDDMTQKQWIDFLRIRLNYDSVQACFWQLQRIKELVDSSRPLASFIDYPDTQAIPFENAFSKSIQISTIIEKELVPLLITQEDYMYAIGQVLNTLVSSAVKQSAKTLEYAYNENLNGDETPIQSGFIPNPEQSVLAQPFSWNYLIQISLTQNPFLRSSLWDNPVLKDRIAELANSEYKERALDEKYKLIKQIEKMK